MGDAERFEIVRPLGADAAGFVARDSSVKPPRLVVLERATRGVEATQDRARVIQRCKALVALEHPKVVPIREVIERDGEVLVVCDYVDGEWLSAVMSLDPRPPVEVLLRVMLDVLEGLAALHDLRDERGQPLHVVHGALSPDSVLVADDGVAEIARPFGITPAKADRFVAPELRRGEPPLDVRADVYSAGAILREILGSASADAKWAEQLTDIAWRACSVDPENRWPSVASMATTLRRVAGSKLASSDDLASFLRRYFGARMNARRSALEVLDEPAPISSGEPISVRASEMVVIDPSSAPTLVESRPPPVPSRAPVARVVLVKKPLEIVDIPEPAIERPGGGVTQPMGAVNLPVNHPIGAVTQKGMAAIAPPAQIFEPPLRPKAVSLPPPDIIVPDVIEAPLPAPANPVARASVAPKPDEESESYRRRMPTFPTIEPPRRSSAVSIMAIAAGMVTTFGIGWWLGRNVPPPSDAPQAGSASVVSAPVVQPPPTAAIIPTIAASTSTASAPGSSVSAAAATAALTTASASTAAMAPRPTGVATATPMAAPNPAANAAKPAPGPSATAVEPRPTVAPKPPPPPRPEGSAGYVPGEL
jgi:serine/threonine-protein kinase